MLHTRAAQGESTPPYERSALRGEPLELTDARVVEPEHLPALCELLSVETQLDGDIADATAHRTRVLRCGASNGGGASAARALPGALDELRLRPILPQLAPRMRKLTDGLIVRETAPETLCGLRILTELLEEKRIREVGVEEGGT